MVVVPLCRMIHRVRTSPAHVGGAAQTGSIIGEASAQKGVCRGEEAV